MKQDSVNYHASCCKSLFQVTTEKTARTYSAADEYIYVILFCNYQSIFVVNKQHEFAYIGVLLYELKQIIYVQACVIIL
jgi:hypothetical protein